MAEELKDKIDAQETVEELREKYPEYVSKKLPADDMAQEQNGD